MLARDEKHYIVLSTKDHDVDSTLKDIACDRKSINILAIHYGVFKNNIFCANNETVEISCQNISVPQAMYVIQNSHIKIGKTMGGYLSLYKTYLKSNDFIVIIRNLAQL